MKIVISCSPITKLISFITLHPTSFNVTWFEMHTNSDLRGGEGELAKKANYSTD